MVCIMDENNTIIARCGYSNRLVMLFSAFTHNILKYIHSFNLVVNVQSSSRVDFCLCLALQFAVSKLSSVQLNEIMLELNIWFWLYVNGRLTSGSLCCWLDEQSARMYFSILTLLILTAHWSMNSFRLTAHCSKRHKIAQNRMNSVHWSPAIEVDTFRHWMQPIAKLSFANTTQLNHALMLLNRFLYFSQSLLFFSMK